MKDKKSWMLFVLMLVALVGLLWLVFLPGCRDETAAEKVAMDTFPSEEKNMFLTADQTVEMADMVEVLFLK